MKHCSLCRELKDLGDFYRHPSGKDGYMSSCKDCKKDYGRARYDSTKRRERTLREGYGLTLADYDHLLEGQNGCCAICGSDNPGHTSGRFVVDHCHDSGLVRGLLCSNCNLLLGHSKDNPVILSSAINYLRTAYG